MDERLEWRMAVDDTLPTNRDDYVPEYDRESDLEDSEDAAYLDAVAQDEPPRCYSDHNEDIRTKGSCDYCGGTDKEKA